MGLGLELLKLSGKAIIGSAKLGNQLSHRVTETIEDHRARTSREAKKFGYALAGEHIGYDGAGVRDYRELLLPNQLTASDKSALASGEFQLGRMIHPRKQEEDCPFSIAGDIIYRHQLLVAPSGSGKTYGVIVPAILSLLSNDFRVVVNDVKGDMLALIKSAKEQQQIRHKFTVKVWNPFQAAHSHCWNPLDELSSWQDSQTIRSITDALLGSDDSQGAENTHFIRRDKRWLKGLIMLIKKQDSRANFAQLYDLLTNNQVKLAQLIQIEPDFSIKADLKDLLDIDSSLYLSGLASVLSVFAERDTASVTRKSDFTINDILHEPGLLILHSPIYQGEKAWQLSALFIGMMKDRICSGLSHAPSVKTSWMIDEAAFIAPRISLDKSLAQIRSYGVGIMMAIQAISQLGDEQRRGNYTANCESKILLQHVDRLSAEFLSKEIGQKTVQNYSKSIGSRAQNSLSRQLSEVPILSPSDIMHYPLGFGDYVGLFYNARLSSSPILLDFTR